MEFQSGAPRLSDMSNGVLGLGTVPFPRFQRSFQGDENTGIVTLLAAATAINSLVVTGALVGDRILVVSRFDVVRGAGGTSVEQIITRTAGPGDVNFHGGGNSHTARHRMGAVGERLSYTQILVGGVPTAGDMTIEQQGSSSNADVTVAVGAAQMYIWLIPGS